MKKREKVSAKVKKALKHEDKLGAGAKKRKELDLTPEENTQAIMKEWKKGTLHSGSGEIVKNPKQAYAIAANTSNPKKKLRVRNKRG